jgi:hypothetical protein
MFWGLVCCIALAVLVGSGCTSDEPDIHIELCGDLEVPRDIDALRVVITDLEGNPVREGVREMWMCPGPRLRQLPQTLAFDPVDQEVFVSVRGLKDGAPVLRSQIRTTLSPNQTRATVALTQSCVGAACADGETCVDGECELIAFASPKLASCPSGSTSPPPASDAATDAGDTSTPDVEQGGADYLCPEDTGSNNADSPDSGAEPDEGVDAPSAQGDSA